MSITYIKHLIKQNYNALGFVPLPKIEEALNRGLVLVEHENDEPCGFLYYGNNFPVLKIYMACIQYDARRIKHGINLVRKLINIAHKRNCTAISLWCADDLEANQFWQQSGFIFTGKRTGGSKRGRTHNHWVLPLKTLF